MNSPYTSKFIGILLVMMMFLQSCKKDDEPTKKDDTTSGEFAIDVGESQIPYVVISTSGAIQNAKKIAAEMSIYMKKELLQTNFIGIEYRGSTSFRLSDKKSYGIETWDEAGEDLDVSFFGWPEEEDWILMGQVVNLEENYQFDNTLLYHHLGYTISRKMDRYAARTQYVEVEINGDYQGIYVFMEKLKRDGDRIDLSKLNPDEISGEDLTGGYILKIDKTSGGDGNANQPLEYFENNWDDDARYTAENSFRSAYDINGQLLNFEPYGSPYHANMYLETYFNYEYPDADDIVAKQKTYIQNYIHDFEEALLTDDFSSEQRAYTDFIDVSTFVDYFLINELCRNVDAYRLSTYVTKDKNGLLSMGPVWDMNIGFDNGGRIPMDDWVINYNNHVSQDAWMMPFWWPRLMADPQFKALVKTRWQELRSGALSLTSLNALVDESATYLVDNGAIARNETVWSIGSDYNQSIENLKNYFSERTSWMDSEINGF